MKALSIRQPFAWAVIHAAKDVENRTWRTDYRGPLLIHASKRKPTIAEMEAFFQLWEKAWVDGLRDGATSPIGMKDVAQQFEYGGIVGQVEVIGCCAEDDTLTHDGPVPDASMSAWFAGPYGLVLRDPKPLPFREYRGRLGLFEVKL